MTPEIKTVLLGIGIGCAAGGLVYNAVGFAAEFADWLRERMEVRYGKN